MAKAEPEKADYETGYHQHDVDHDVGVARDVQREEGQGALQLGDAVHAQHLQDAHGQKRADKGVQGALHEEGPADEPVGGAHRRMMAISLRRP